LAGPYRQALTRLQDAAPRCRRPPCPPGRPGRPGRAGRPNRGGSAARRAAPAATGRGTAGGGRPDRGQPPRPVAVKIQYPGAGEALVADLTQLSRVAGLFRALQPGLDVKALLAELRARVTEELDYQLEASAQQAFAEAYADDPGIKVP